MPLTTLGFHLIENPFCGCIEVKGNETCHRALCADCGSYLADHQPSAEAAANDASWVNAHVHRCNPYGVGSSTRPIGFLP